MSGDCIVPPCRPYIVRALYDWMSDNSMTPLIAVNVNFPGVELPLSYAQNGVIVLNISPSAVRNLNIDNEGISFSARFGGVPHDVYVPMIAVTTIYPREDISLGMCLFPEKAYDEGNINAYSKNNINLNPMPEEEKMPIFEIIDNASSNMDKKLADAKENQNNKTNESSEHKKPNFEIVE